MITNKNRFIIILCFVLFSSLLLMGCVEEEVDPREKEIVQLVVNEKYDEAKIKTKELYKDDSEKIEEFLTWIDDMIESDNRLKAKIQDAYPSQKLEIQKGYQLNVRNGYGYITGHVKNVSNSDIEYFEVVVKFKDDNDQVLNSDYTNDNLKLSSGEMREFEIMTKWKDEYKVYSLSIGEVK